MATRTHGKPVNDSGAYEIIESLKLGKRNQSKMRLGRDEVVKVIAEARELYDRLGIVGTESGSILEDEQSGDFLQEQSAETFGSIQKLIDSTEALVQKVFEGNTEKSDLRKEVEALRKEGDKAQGFVFAELSNGHEKSSYSGLEEDEYVRREIFMKIKNLLEKIERFIS